MNQKRCKSDTAMASRRFNVSWMGEYYMDMLGLEAKLKNRTVAIEAASLLASKLGEREIKRKTMIDHLALKRGISYEEMLLKLLDPKFKLAEDEIFTDE